MTGISSSGHPDRWLRVTAISLVLPVGAVLNVEQIDGLPPTTAPGRPRQPPTSLAWPPPKQSLPQPALPFAVVATAQSTTRPTTVRQIPPHDSFRDAVSYATKELTAELGAAFLRAELNITLPPLREDHAGYLAHWLELLKADSRAIFAAARQAQRTADHLHGLRRPGWRAGMRARKHACTRSSEQRCR